ncbi:MAG: MBOAT family O-acyltransferase [Deltaproteobacteria bacterium]
MLFNSIDFAIFLPVVFLFYWFVFNKNLKIQNLFIVASSFLFYAWWDWRFLFLMIGSASVDFIVGNKLRNQESRSIRRIYLILSLVINLGILGFFKYFNFFAQNFVSAFSFFGKSFDLQSLNIILPVGISFYTFQALSYTIDVYRKKLNPTSSVIDFFAFISFFPQLVAGPIERATNLLPQFYKPRSFDYYKGVDGLRQILWGLFKKIVIADTAAEYVNQIFGNYEAYSGSTLALAAFMFAFQIYCDFSGYSDIAIGTARLFGFDLMRNFSFPYFSRDIAEFWRRWHISLSTWFRDYVYIPLGGSKVSKGLKVRNTFIIFVLSGFWHGANWTFIAWGLLNAIYFLPLLLYGKNRTNLDTIAHGKLLPSLNELTKMIMTFTLTTVAWVFFRSVSIEDSLNYLAQTFSASFFSLPYFSISQSRYLFFTVFFLFIFIEWYGRERQYALQILGLKWKQPIRYAFYYFLVLLIFYFGGKEQQFIYFQF